MKKPFWLIAILILFCFLSLMILNFAPQQESFGEFSPRLKNGKKWNIGYVQSGKFRNYDIALKNFIDQLAVRGWLEPVDWKDLPPKAGARTIWLYLSQNMKSKYIQIETNNFWCAQWDRSCRKIIRKNVIETLNSKKIDLMLAMGTWAGQDIANNQHSVPTIYLGSPFPVGNIFKNKCKIPSHLYLPENPDFLLRQIRLFRKITKFKTLGVVYVASSEGRFMSSLKILKQLSKKEKFKLVAIRVLPHSCLKSEEYLASHIKAHEKIAPQIDAMWLTSGFMNNPDEAQKILAPLYKHRIPTWYPHGEVGIGNGAVFGVIHNPERRADHYAEITAKILNGIEPASLIQPLPADNQLVINCAAAQKIGMKIPKTLLSAAKRTFLTINAGNNIE